MMVSGGHPDQLKARHNVIALMVAAGWKQKDIAEQLGFHENRISIIAQSPLFRVHVQDIQKKMREGLIDDVNELIRAEAIPSMRRLVALRDHASGEPGENTQLAAANSLLDRGAPKVTRQELDYSLTIKLSKEDMGVMEEVAEELGEVIEAEVDEPPYARTMHPSDYIQPRSLDDLELEVT